MKANNLTISVPTIGLESKDRCRGNCPYCISKMTFGTLDDFTKFGENLNKARAMAERAGVTSVLITGKREPVDSEPFVKMVCDAFKDFPLEIQVKWSHINDDVMLMLRRCKIDTIAVSTDNINKKFLNKLEMMSKVMTVRVTLNASDMYDGSFDDFIGACQAYGARQASIRRLTVPTRRMPGDESDKAAVWIEKHEGGTYERLMGEFAMRHKDASIIRRLPFGAVVYDIDGLAFTHFDYCIQENNNTEDIRSLIYQADGHMYTAWDSPGSILF